jgi:orotidine-5'-phosphate decarboxylase
MTAVATKSRFAAKFAAASSSNDSLLCVGLDPDSSRIPTGIRTRDFLHAIVEATSDLVCCYKPNIAFFEPDIDGGMPMLRELIAAVPDDVPVLLDAKRNDIGNTAEAYAQAVFDGLDADAVVVNPYLGRDSLEPFLVREDRHSFVLCRTSNPGAGDLQDLPVGEEGRPLYEHVARLASEWNTRGNVGLVVGATYPAEAAAIRAVAPELPFLMPGVGAQTADLEAAVIAGLDARQHGILVNASRGVIYAGGEAEAGGDLVAWADAARASAEALRDAINAARQSASAANP